MSVPAVEPRLARYFATFRAVLCCVVLSAMLPCAGWSQVPGDPESPPTEAAEGEAAPARGRGGWRTLWSRRTPHDRIILGMLSTHVYELDEGLSNNNAFGVIHGGGVAATFITTHGRRGWVAAVERSWLEGTLGPTRTMLGFRAGLLYGYDERLFELAEWTPIIPYGQPVFLIRVGPLSLDFTYTWVVMSLTAGASL